MDSDEIAQINYVFACDWLRYPLTKKRVPSRVRKHVRHETELGRFTAEQLK